MDYQAFLKNQSLAPSYLDTALKWFKPLGVHIASHHDSAKKPFFLGVNGAQGSGKSTLCAFLQFYLSQQHGLNVVTLSLDDFYLSQSDRLAMSVKVHPLFKTRGVPGTHDIALLQKTLERLAEYGTVSLPRFSKATDNPASVLEWPVVNAPVDVVLMEGWCWGAEPQTDAQLRTSENELEREHDALGVWREYVNQTLKRDYLDLYAKMHYWVMLKAPSFDCVADWRIEQEHKLKQRLTPTDAHSAVMNDTQIRQFISYFERLTKHVLATLPDKVDCLYELDAQRHIMAAQASFL